ncbi:hypothetical protein GUITHDRAFT_148646 [Guillardia theta CCMP2712]|uniref:Uncharacterized protein n=1 Tax=Guillardia theta (strain CCMP2712) TaxID=905079 RepID=L1I934_GUITC|nr:hypothetical protein GUITHDRAFT_148646 [Guillardia theta CCMP2712]EKX32404.1 hypothetical protein GUITHDRAFT_148646 [Guillardia theta CCMP2712]|eukprot:XP_005819384.1 hypothetical protein GUITHDRAFT_148646 [Guillardia theta CCMP2712]
MDDEANYAPKHKWAKRVAAAGLAGLAGYGTYEFMQPDKQLLRHVTYGVGTGALLGAGSSLLFEDSPFLTGYVAGGVGAGAASVLGSGVWGLSRNGYRGVKALVDLAKPPVTQTGACMPCGVPRSRLCRECMQGLYHS